MTFDRFAAPAFAAGLLVLGLVRCEPADEGPPPATAPNAAAAATAGDAPEPAAPAPPPAVGRGEPAPGAPAGGDDAAYASAPYVIGADADSYDDDDPSALADFHGTLDPYGAWVDDTRYGTVWVPSSMVVGADFTPYVTAGHWAYDDDWVWVSDYPWGWAPFHYGRWLWIEGRGWAWVPGRVYRGAWVVWSVDEGYTYVGWAPAPPAFVWFGGVAVGWTAYVGPRWVYCPRRDVFVPAVATRVVAAPAVAPAVAARMHVYAGPPGTPSGPPPQRLGFAAGAIPHVSGTAAAGVARAQQFARPSTAQPLGARPPAPAPPTARAARVTSPRPSGAFTAPPSAPPGRGTRPSVVVTTPVRPPAARPSSFMPAPRTPAVRAGGGRR